MVTTREVSTGPILVHRGFAWVGRNHFADALDRAGRIEYDDTWITALHLAHDLQLVATGREREQDVIGDEPWATVGELGPLELGGLAEDFVHELRQDAIE